VLGGRTPARCGPGGQWRRRWLYRLRLVALGGAEVAIPLHKSDSPLCSFLRGFLKGGALRLGDIAGLLPYVDRRRLPDVIIVVAITIVISVGVVILILTFSGLRAIFGAGLVGRFEPRLLGVFVHDGPPSRIHEANVWATRQVPRWGVGVAKLDSPKSQVARFARPVSGGVDMLLLQRSVCDSVVDILGNLVHDETWHVSTVALNARV
jgi:hypothetical protein